MGGERETTSPQTVTDKSVKGKVRVIGHVRYHESGGEIHFHDDQVDLKVTVPSATWIAIMQDMMRTTPSRRQIPDLNRKTVLYVRLKSKPKWPKEGETATMIASLRVAALNANEEFEGLYNFTFET